MHANDGLHNMANQLKNYLEVKNTYAKISIFLCSTNHFSFAFSMDHFKIKNCRKNVHFEKQDNFKMIVYLANETKFQRNIEPQEEKDKKKHQISIQTIQI